MVSRKPKLPKSHKPDDSAQGDLAVITCHFNWAGFSRPKQNLLRFIRQMRAARIPVYGVEAYLPGCNPVTKNFHGWKQVEADPDSQVMFQKERMLNMAERLVPESFTKIAWLDADIFFGNKDWHVETSVLLEHFGFVQPFETAVWTDMDGAELFRKPSTLRLKGGLPLHSHPGFAMAATRDFWVHAGGLFEHLIVGNGDVGVVTAILDKSLPSTQTYSPQLFARYVEWNTKVAAFAKRKGFRFTKGTIWHEWHGSLANRKYIERNRLLLEFLPEYAAHGDNGLMTWQPGTPRELIENVRAYFFNRQEDSTSKPDE